MGDPERYRKQEEVRKWEESDPIGVYHKYLTENKIASIKSLDEVDAQVMDEVQKAVEFAEASPEPTMEDLYADVYAE
jgi:pyruvate dehydrogenase E1 component alpha subunit